MERNYNLEEYKLLKDEAKTFTNQTFRDFQLFIGIITIFFALINSKEADLPKFASYAFMQLAVFIFLVIQFSRIVYLIIVRKHLAQLEDSMNKEFDKNFIFKWESVVVPAQIAPLRSYSSISQIAIGVMYLGIFLFLCYQSLCFAKTLTSDEKQLPMWTYYSLLGIEVVFIVFSLICIRKQRNN